MRRLVPLRLLLLILVPALATAAWHLQAAFAVRPFTLEVTPACCRIGFTAYAFGIFPLDGHFSAFQGLISVEPGTPARARAEARIDATSLTLDGGPIEADVKAPHFLDVARHRLILFQASGTQEGAVDTLRGFLTIKGVTNPVVLALSEEAGIVTAEARISRRTFGITARPILAGDTIAIRITAPLPR